MNGTSEDPDARPQAGRPEFRLHSLVAPRASRGAALFARMNRKQLRCWEG